jgi:hypothetical protein
VDWIGLAQDRNRWRVLVNSVLNLRVPWNAGKLSSDLTSSGRSSLLLSSNRRSVDVVGDMTLGWSLETPRSAHTHCRQTVYLFVITGMNIFGYIKLAIQVSFRFQFGRLVSDFGAAIPETATREQVLRMRWAAGHNGCGLEWHNRKTFGLLTGNAACRCCCHGPLELAPLGACCAQQGACMSRDSKCSVWQDSTLLADAPHSLSVRTCRPSGLEAAFVMSLCRGPVAMRIAYVSVGIAGSVFAENSMMSNDWRKCLETVAGGGNSLFRRFHQSAALRLVH